MKARSQAKDAPEGPIYRWATLKASKTLISSLDGSSDRLGPQQRLQRLLPPLERQGRTQGGLGGLWHTLSHGQPTKMPPLFP